LSVIGVLVLAACASGVGPNPAVPRATIQAYRTEVATLRTENDEQRATLAAMAALPGTPVPPPFAQTWKITITGPSRLEPLVGARDDLTPVAAEGIYLIVPVRVTNLMRRAAYFNPVSQLVVVDNQDRTFDLHPTAWGAAYVLDAGYDPEVGARQPGIPFPNVLVFDVAADATDFTLKSVDGSLSVKLDA
jgi:hypothetical protein